MPYKLTAKTPDPLTGQQNSYIGWHFVMTDALDVLASCLWLENQTPWSFQIFANPDNKTLLRMSVTGPVGNFADQDGQLQQVMAQFIVDDTDYYIYDNGHFKTIFQDEAEADYDIEPCELPTPPPPQADPVPQALGVPVQIVPPPREGDPVPGAQM